MAVLSNIIPFILATVSQHNIASGLASVLDATTPLWRVLIAHASTTDEKLSGNRIIGVRLGDVRVACLMQLQPIDSETFSVIGLIMVIVATISYASAGFWRRRLRETPPIASAAC